MQKKCFWDKRHYSVSAEVVGAVFEDIEGRYGKVTPQNFLDESRPEESPTHKLFEWDDEKAAENYRRQQAQRVILDLRIEIIKDDGESTKAPAYVNVAPVDDVGSYYNTVRAFSVRETREIVLKRAYNELEAFRTKYRNLKELAKVIDAIDVVLEGA